MVKGEAMASIEVRTNKKTKKKHYRAQIRLKGHPSTSATFERMSDAKRWAAETELNIRNGKYFKEIEAKKHTLSDLIKRYKDKELPKIKSRNVREKHLEYWENKLGHLTLDDITKSKLVECRDELAQGETPKKTKRTSATVNRYMATLSHAFSIAYKEWEWIDESPFRKLPKLKEPRGRVRFLDDEERKTLLELCKNHNEVIYTIVVIAISTGARRGEILSLRWDQVNVNTGMITLHETKNDERRSIPLQGHALELVKKLGKVRRLDTDLLFPSKKNPDKPISIDNVWKKIIKESGIIDFRFHDLRHSAASYLAMGGATIPEIANVLGHKTLQMVQRYSHIGEQHTLNVVAKMNDNIFSSE